MEVVVRPLGLEDLPPDALENFRRFQVTRQVLYWEQGEYKLKDDSFVDEWGADKKRRVVRDCAAAWNRAVLLAGPPSPAAHWWALPALRISPWAAATSTELRYLHVSREHRGRGLGRQLFRLCCEAARQLGAEKLYIGGPSGCGNPGLYASLGCVPAAEIVPEILALEPRDLQLECTL